MLMDQKRRRKIIRIVLAVLAIIPILLLIQYLFFGTNISGDDSIEEMAFTVIGIPILVFNFWAWYYPELIENFLWGNKDNRE